MKKNIIIFFAFCFLLFSAMKCSKEQIFPPSNVVSTDDTTKLPPATQIGANAFGFLLNGKVWRPHYISLPEITVDYFQGILDVDAVKKYGSPEIFQSLAMTVDINRNNPVKDYVLNSPWGMPDKWKGGGAIFSDYINKGSGTTDSIWTGKLSITRFDTINRIISGTFSMTLWNSYIDTIKITQGRFDNKY